MIKPGKKLKTQQYITIQYYKETSNVMILRHTIRSSINLYKSPLLIIFKNTKQY